MSRRFLVVCDGGNVRSHALAYVLKYDHQQEAIAIGRWFMSEASIAYFCDWADVIVTTRPHMSESIRPEYQHQIVCWDMGEDVWGYGFHQDLLKKAKSGADWLVNEVLRLSR